MDEYSVKDRNALRISPFIGKLPELLWVGSGFGVDDNLRSVALNCVY